MRINSIDGSLCKTGKMYFANRNSSVNRNIKTDTDSTVKQIAFKSSGGKIVGGLFGTIAGGLGALVLLANPIGLVATAATLVAEVGGAVIGGEIGDAVTGKDDF